MTTRRFSRRGAAGFTLAELLITIAIIGIVSSLGLRAYLTAIDYYGLARSKGESDQAIQSAMETIRADVNSVLPSSLTGVSVSGSVQNRAGGKTNSVLMLPVSVPTLADGRSTAAWVRYDVRYIQESGRLVRSAGPLYQDLKEDAGTDVVFGVLGFNAEYLDDNGAWVSTWPLGQSPVAVRVTLTVRDPDSILAPAVTRSLVFRVSAQ